MAKVKPSIISVKGKIDNKVIVDSKFGAHVRNLPKKHKKKYSPKFTAQSKRTSLLNKLAGEIDRWIELYYARLQSDNFYKRLLQCFRVEPSNERYILLQTLKNFEVNPDYPLDKLGECNLEIRDGEDKILVELEVTHHPRAGKYEANCYYNDLLLLCWTRTGESAIAEKQPSDWISLKDEKPVFDFEFRKPEGATHWMLFHRQRLGKNNSTFDANSLVCEGMRVAAIGSFDKDELALLEQVYAERQAKIVKELRDDEEERETRVKARRRKES